MAKGPISPRHFQLMGQLKGSSELEAVMTFSFLIRGLLSCLLKLLATTGLDAAIALSHFPQCPRICASSRLAVCYYLSCYILIIYP